MARLASHIWVSAYLRRLSQEAIAAYIVAKGDAQAGAILVKLNTLDGQACLFERRFEQEDYIWEAVLTDSEAKIDEALARQRGFDRDLWIIEVEDQHGRHLLDVVGR